MTEKKKKTTKKNTESAASPEQFGSISSRKELKTFLTNVRDKISDEVAAPVYSMGAMNYVLNLPDIYSLLDSQNKEIARDIWLRLKQSGLELRNPPLLFSEDEEAIA